jgi:hypothetical protein
MATAKVNVKAPELPVRTVTVFGRQIVVPLDTACHVTLVNEINHYQDQRGHVLCFHINAVVQLYHSHFPGQEIRTREQLCEFETANQRLLKRRVLQEKKFPHSHHIPVRVQLAIFKLCRKEALVAAMNEMFLAGNINQEGLVRILPKQNCLG